MTSRFGDNYGGSLRRRLIDRQWPDFENPEFLTTLEELANDGIARKTLEGHLAALLIYHQLSEAAARVLLECARFFMQLSLYPAEIAFSDPKNAMAGYWIAQLEATIEFEGKAEFLSGVRAINKLRNSVFHGITKQTSSQEIKSRLDSLPAAFDSVMITFMEAHDWFSLCFKDFSKDGEWLEKFDELEE